MNCAKRDGRLEFVSMGPPGTPGRAATSRPNRCCRTVEPRQATADYITAVLVDAGLAVDNLPDAPGGRSA